MVCLLYKELIGSALPAVPGDELDVTSSGGTKQSKQPESLEVAEALLVESPGLSVVTKLIFFGLIVGVIFSFLRTRKPTVSEKSLA